MGGKRYEKNTKRKERMGSKKGRIKVKYCYIQIKDLHNNVNLEVVLEVDLNIKLKLKFCALK